jgi:hypothetical protein
MKAELKAPGTMMWDCIVSGAIGRTVFEGIRDMINRTALSSWVQAAVFALAILGVSHSQAVTLFTVDTTNDKLMLLDSATGTVTEVGPLGDDALDIDLSLTGDGRLWGLNTDRGARVDLWEINKTSGAIISTVQVLDGAGALTAAEGLGAQGNQLKIGYDPTGGFNSSTIANLSMTGVVSVGVSSIADMDGLSSGNGNPIELYGSDRTPGVNTLLFGINPATGTQTIIGTYPESRNFNDLVTLPGEAVLLDYFSDEIYRIDIVTGSILGSPTLLLLDGNYIGLALADQIPSAVEAPGNGSIPGPINSTPMHQIRSIPVPSFASICRRPGRWSCRSLTSWGTGSRGSCTKTAPPVSMKNCGRGGMKAVGRFHQGCTSIAWKPGSMSKPSA